MTPEPGERLDAGRRDGHQVVRREGAQLGGERGAPGVDELVGVEAGQRGRGGRRPRAPGATPRRRTPPPRRRRRRSGRARPRRWPARSRRRPGRPSAPAGRRPAVLGRHLVGGEQGRHQVHRMPAGGRADGAQLLELVLRVEAVAALRLGGGGAPGEHRSMPPEDVAPPAPPRSPARVAAHGREDAAAGGGDLLVGLAGEARRELLLAAAGPGEVGVGIDEAGDQRAAAAVEPLGLGQLAEAAPPLLGRPDEGDAAVAADHLGVAQSGGPAPARRPRRGVSPPAWRPRRGCGSGGRSRWGLCAFPAGIQNRQFQITNRSQARLCWASYSALEAQGGRPSLAQGTALGWIGATNPRPNGVR